QIHRSLAVAMPRLRMWVHCPRASNGSLPRRSNLVGYTRWTHGLIGSSLPDNHSNSFPGRSLPFLICRFTPFSRMKHQKEVSPLSGPVMLSMELTQPVSVPLQSGIRFLLPLMSAPPSAHLAMCFPGVGIDTDLSCSVGMTR